MERKLIPVKDNPNLARDPNSGAILNVNRTSLAQAREAKRKRKEKEKQDIELAQRVERLESGMNEIKDLLTRLVEKE